MKEQYFTFDHIHNVIRKSAQDIRRDNFKPDYILAIASGGLIPARIMKTFIDAPIISITVSSYDDSKQECTNRIKKEQWIDGVSITGKKILVVDDIDDSRATIEYCLSELLIQNPSEIAMFVLHNKKREKKGKYPEQIQKIYMGEEVDDHWIHYPWESTNIHEYQKKCELTE
jgi:hypoxanthine phosphoribosyltransferase